MDEGGMQSCIYGWGIFPRHSLLVEEVQPAGHKRRHVLRRGILHPDGFSFVVSAYVPFGAFLKAPTGA